MGLGQKTRARLRRIANPLSEKPTGSDGDLCLLQVIPVSRGVNGRIDKDDKSIELIVLENLECLGNPVGQ